MYFSSRTQKVISLSSGEAEVYAASSAACDSILLAKMVSFLTGAGAIAHHLLDLSGARGILSRRRVERIWHLSCRILWLQTLVKLRKDFSCDLRGRKIHSTCHLVSAVSRHLICNLGFIDNDTFTVVEDFQSIRSIQKIKHAGNLIAGPTLVHEPVQCCKAEL